MTALVVDDITVSYGRLTALRGVTLTVEEGEILFVTGPNGAGKSTLLQLAAARLHPTAGDVGVLDEVLGAVDVFELRPRIGLSSAQLAAQVPANETVQDAVVTAAYGITGTWRERYETEDRARALVALGDALAQHLPALAVAVLHGLRAVVADQLFRGRRELIEGEILQVRHAACEGDDLGARHDREQSSNLGCAQAVCAVRVDVVPGVEAVALRARRAGRGQGRSVC